MVVVAFFLDKDFEVAINLRPPEHRNALFAGRQQAKPRDQLTEHRLVDSGLREEPFGGSRSNVI